MIDTSITTHRYPFNDTTPVQQRHVEMQTKLFREYLGDSLANPESIEFTYSKDMLVNVEIIDSRVIPPRNTIGKLGELNVG